MKNNKNYIFHSICIIFLFLLSGCTVIGNTNLPTFKPVDDSENVIAFYKDNDDNYYDYYDNNSQCILFFNTKSEKITHEWNFNKAIEENVCGMTSFFETKIIENEIFIFQNNRIYHIKKDTGELIFLKDDNSYNIKAFIDDKILVEGNNLSYIYNPQNNTLEKTKFSSYYDTFFALNDKYFYEYCGDIYSYETEKLVYKINESDDDYYNQRIINNTNFYTISSSKEVTNENNEIIIKTKELKEIIINNDGDLDSITVTALNTNRDLLTVIKNSDTQITSFETDKNYYLHVNIYTKENGVWTAGIEKITKDDKIKISTTWDEYYSSNWIEEQNGAYWIKDSNNCIMKINKTDFNIKEIKL